MKRLKKLFAITLCLLAMLQMVACGGNQAESSTSAPEANPSTNSAPSTNSTPATDSAPELDWPQKDLTFIIPAGTGGDTDYCGRLLAAGLEKELGVTCVIQNVTGNNFAVGHNEFYNIKPDGHTFMLSNSNPFLLNEITGLDSLNYEDFSPIAIYGKHPGESFFVSADAPWDTFEELMADCIASPESIKLAIATGGTGAVVSAILDNTYGAKFAIIGAGDGSERVTAVLGGQAEACLVSYSVGAPYVESGDFKCLASTLSVPPDFSDIPSATDCGYPELVIDTRYLLVGHRDEDPAILQALSEAAMKVVNEHADYKEAINAYTLQDPYCLSIEDTLDELITQREHLMTYKEYLS